MSHEATIIPQTADELISHIDRAKAEPSSADVVLGLKSLAYELTSNSPVKGDEDIESPHQEARFLLVDGREAAVFTYVNRVHSDSANVIITTLDKIKDKSGTTHAIRKRYFITGDELELNVNPIYDLEGQDPNHPNAYSDEVDEPGMDKDEERAVYKHRAKGSDLSWRMGMYDASNEEVINLTRLLRTAEPIVYKNS